MASQCKMEQNDLSDVSHSGNKILFCTTTARAMFAE